MENLKQAYKTMGLQEFADKAEVEKRYTTLLKRERTRAKSQSAESASSETDSDEFTRITEAYRLILAHEDQKITQAFNEQEYGKYKGMAGQAQKLDHFWRYYKFHTFGAIALFAAIIYGIVSYIDHREEQKYLASLPPIDLSVSFMGLFMEPEGNEPYAVAQSMLKSFPDWKRVESSILFIPKDDASQYAYLQKAVVTLISEVPDIYIMDREMFQWIGGQGALMKLEDKPELSAYMNGELALKLKTEENGTEAVYGIDLAKSQLFTDLPLVKTDLIAGIRNNAPNPENAVKFIEAYAKSLPQ